MSKFTIITGAAGVGKSTHLSKMVKDLKAQGKVVAICAPTGLAAQNVGGVTIHSLLGINPFKKEINLSQAKREALRKLDCLIVDEFSMIGKELFETMSLALKKAMSNNLPFGGKEVYLYGDILQLPPINESNDYFFESSEFSVDESNVIYLDVVKRQTDPKFIGLLNSLRIGNVSEDDLEYINSFSASGTPSDLCLFPQRADVHRMNEERLNLIEGKEFKFQCQNIHGDPKSVQGLMKAVLPPALLKLKVSARVMVTVNDPGGSYFNGSQGIFLGQTDDCLKIKLDSGRIIELARVSFGNNNPYNPCSFDQFPLTLAYAMTVHKAQGMTIENLTVDFTREHGTPFLAYVALSRVRSPSGLTIKGFTKSLVRCDQRAIEFDKALRCKHTYAPSV